MNWLRWYTGSATDPKFAAVARRSGQNVAAVLAVWAMLLERACEADTRGDVEGFDCEGADVVLGLSDGAACAVVDALKAKGLIVQGRLANWEKRQPKREDDSAERVREYRARKREAQAAASREVTHGNAPVTQCNATSREVTHGNARGEEIREEYIISCSPPYPPTGGEDGEDTPDIAFEQFAEAYPADKLDKDAAYIAWKTLAKKRTLPGLPELFCALAAWQASEQWQTDGGKYVPLASNFLGKGIYRRTPQPPKPRARPRASPPGKLTGEALTRRNMETARRVLAELEAQHER